MQFSTVQVQVRVAALFVRQSAATYDKRIADKYSAWSVQNQWQGHVLLSKDSMPSVNLCFVNVKECVKVKLSKSNSFWRQTKESCQRQDMVHVAQFLFLHRIEEVSPFNLMNQA